MVDEAHTQQTPTGPGRPRAFEESEALAAALDVFWRQGYEATSLDDLTGAMNLSRSSFYCCFGSKHGALMAAVRRYTEESYAKLAAIAEVEPSARAAVRAMIEATVNTPEERRGCLLVNCVTELAPHDPELADLTRRHLERVEALFAETIVRQEPEGAADRARALVSLAIGAITLRKAGLPAERIDTALAHAETLLPRSG